MSTALMLVDEQPAFTNKQLELIKTTIAPGVDDDQLALFVEVAKRTGLDPFSRQIYAILRNKREQKADNTWHTVPVMTIQTGIDGYRAMAARTGHLAGIDDAIYDTEDGEHPNRATVTVYRLVGGQPRAFTATARWAEYAVYKDEYKGKEKTGNKVPSDMWARMPWLMLGKCAEALALRKAFPNEISGVYTAEEMAQADAPAVVDVTPADQHGPTWDDVKRLAGELGLTNAQKTQLFNVHKRDAAAIYRNLQQMADKAIADREEDAIRFETEESTSLEDLEAARGGHH